MVSAQDKQLVEDTLHMYDSLLAQDPFVLEQRDQGKIEGQQQIIVTIIQARFPTLLELAQQQVARLNDPDKLSRLAQQIAVAPDETVARWALTSLIV